MSVFSGDSICFLFSDTDVLLEEVAVGSKISILSWMLGLTGVAPPFAPSCSLPESESEPESDPDPDDGTRSGIFSGGWTMTTGTRHRFVEVGFRFLVVLSLI